MSLRIGAGGSPQAGRFFEDIGYYAFTGSLDTTTTGRRVEVWQYGSDKKWHRAATTTTDAKGDFAARRNVTARGTQHFRATLGGSPTGARVVRSPEVDVSVRDASVSLSTPKARIDALTTTTVRGSVNPARAGVAIALQVKSGKAYHQKATARTDRSGGFILTFDTGRSLLRSYSVRTGYRVANRDRVELSRSAPIARVKALHAVVRKTTSADVAKTYHPGCPVGPSKLATITMNFYGFDHRLHRGVIIVRANLADEITRSFKKALDAGYPIRKMNNPNAYGGNDPQQMAADNTSGFNCRKVVGNPYAQSPHSYGIAIDANTVENPYRDANGRWWPANGKSYIDRSPRRTGMLVSRSYLTSALRKEGYFWGGLWDPGRDYQHFEYDR